MAEKVAFRVDGSSAMGMGHIVRCIGLAKRLSHRYDILFITRGFEEAVRTIKDAGFPVKELSTSPDEARSIRETLRVVSQSRPDIFITDLLRIGMDFSNELKRAGVRIASLDEMGEIRLRSDVIINSSVVPEWQRYDRLYHVANFFIGTDYFVMRDMFRPFVKRKKRIRETASDVLVIMGGADPDGNSIRALRMLRGICGLNVTLVMGPGFKHRAEMVWVARAHRNVYLADRPEDVAKLMYDADIAICGGGFSLYELAAVGTPAVAMCNAKHELLIAKEMQRRGSCMSMGMGRSVVEKDFLKAVSGLINDRRARQRMSNSGKRAVDGRGGERVVSIIESLKPISFRRAAMDDCRTILDWRNDPVARRFSIKNTKVIPYGEHLDWYKKAICDPKRKLLIVEVGGKQIGMLRFDVSGRSAEVSINLAPDERGKGYGRKVLREGCLRAFDEYGVTRIIARIKGGNASSVNAFTSAGFSTVKRGNILEMAMSKV